MSVPPIQRFFNEVDPSADPFDLLGVDVDACGATEVREALRRRMERLAAHPRGHGPEADEVRLALRVAAAMLLDERVRAEIAFDRGVRARAGRGGMRAGVDGLPPAFERAAVWAIAASGGWNDEAKRRIAALAQAHQLGAEQVREAVALIGRRAAAERSARPAAARRSLPEGAVRALDERVARSKARASAARTVRRWGALVLLVGLAVSSIMAARALVRVCHRLAGDGSRVGTPASLSAEAIAPATVGLPPVPAASSSVSRMPEDSEPPGFAVASTRMGVERPVLVRDRGPTGEAFREWAGALRLVLARPAPADATPMDHLARAVRLARFNLAASALWSGRGVDEAMRSAISGAPVVGSGGPAASWWNAAGLAGPGPAGDGALALELFMQSRRAGQGLSTWRNRRFADMRLGPADCGAAASAALHGTSQEARQVARRIVLDQSDNPAMIHALLKALPRAPRSSATASLIGEATERTLPSADDPVWAARARAALVERLAELVAPLAQPGVDALAAALFEAHADAAGADTGADASAGSEGGSDAPELLWRQWDAVAATYRSNRPLAEQLASIERRRAIRRSLADGPVQRFVAEQASIVEVMAFVISQERPSAAKAARAVVEEAFARRRTARHVFEQVEAGEAAAARLWLIRASVEGAAEGRSR